MKKLLLALSLILAPAAFASTPDFSRFHGDDDNSNPGMREMHKCLKKSWKAAKPTEEQNESAKRNLEEAKAVMEQQKDNLRSAMQAMKDAWKKHPIDQAEVVAAEDSLREYGTPVKAAFRDAGIETINLLSAEQRAKFDSAFKDCID